MAPAAVVAAVGRQVAFAGERICRVGGTGWLRAELPAERTAGGKMLGCHGAMTFADRARADPPYTLWLYMRAVGDRLVAQPLCCTDRCG